MSASIKGVLRLAEDDQLESDLPNEERSATPTPTPSPSIATPAPGATKFDWLKKVQERRASPFVSPRPQIGSGGSSADLLQFESSRANLFNSGHDAVKPANKYSITGISLWGSRTILEKCLIVLSGILLLLAIILGSILASKGGQRERTPELNIPEDIWSAYENYTNLCMSAACMYTSSEIIRSIDLSKDPCEDFYDYSCGGWEKNNPVPDGKSMWGIFSKIELQNQLIIRNALDKINTTKRSKTASKAEIKAKIYYDSCMDVNETIETLAGSPLLEVIRRMGGWSLLPETMKNSQTWSLQKSLQTLQNKYNLGGLFNWAVGEDDRNSSRHVIIVDQGGFTLPTRDNYLNKTAHKKILDAYLEYMIKVSVLLGANETKAKISMQKVIDFETDLANITTPSEERRDEEALYNPMTVTKLQSIAPFLQWRNFFNDAFKLVQHKILDNETVVIYATDYLKKLNAVIDKYQKTDEGKTTLSNYLIWQAVRPLSSYLSKSFREAAKILRKALFGSEGGEELWRVCVGDTNNAIGFAIGAMFVREVFHGESKPQAEEMIDRIRMAFKVNLKNLSWMDDETRKAAEIKADAIGDMIGFPDYILDSFELDKQYADLNVRSNEYFQNNIEVNLYTLKKNLERLDEPVNKTRWGMTPSTVNAYYTPTKNQIVFPAGILQPPFYDGLSPRSVNYGAMGVVMGHELTHAFDDQGREYDRFGNLNQWWNNRTIEQFKTRAKCIQDQYSNFTFDGHHLNGKQTLGENIADNGGLKASFHAYLEWSKTSMKNETLPGLPFNHRQLFFISFAQVWCSSMTKEAAKLQIEKDDHTVAKFRVIGPLSNLPEFSKEFSCPLGSRMNPIRKCEVW